MSDIKVSVIVPIYNVEAFLERCLESLVQQTLNEIEIILVNDGSPDNSQAIIDKYTDLYPNKVIGLVKENGGLSDARNYGIPYARGEYIGFVDSDDYVDLTMYEKLYNKAITSESDIVVCGYYGIDENKESFRHLQKGNMAEFGQSLSENPNLLHMNSPYAWNKLFKKELFTKSNILFPKGLIYEDIATVYPLFMYANKISKVDEALYYYILKREGAITATFSENILLMFKALARMNDLYIQAGKFEEFKPYLSFINLRHTVYRFRDFVLYNDKKLQRKVVNEGFAHLDKYFSDWRDNELFFNAHYKNNKRRAACSKSKLYWLLYILVPNKLIKITNQTIHKLKWANARKSNPKYAYAKYVKKCPIVENQVLFESFHGQSLNDSPFAMMRELAKEGKYKIFYTTKRELMDKHKELIDEYGLDIELVPLGSDRYQKVLATSQYLVNNVSFPTYFMKREGQKYLNTWHGTPLKTLGKKMANGIQDMSNMQRNFLQSTHLLHPNEFTMDHMMEDYNLNHLFTGKVILEGYPRNAVFLDRNLDEEIRRKYKMENKEVIAYMPTWRGALSTSANGASYQNQILSILNRIDESLNDNQILYVNLHTLLKDSIDIEGYKHIQKFPSDVNNYDFLNACDVLITDYSSVFFDYSITKKPIVLFMYDYDEYMSERGMYFDVRTLPFEKIYNIEDLVSYLSLPNKAVNMADSQYIDYCNRFIKYDSIDSIRKVNHYFFHEDDEDIKVFDYSKNKDIEHTLYLSSKIKHQDDYEKLEVLNELNNPIGLFLRNDFTSHTIDILSTKYNDTLDYIVSDQNMNATLFETIRLFVCRKLNIYFVHDLYRREVKRLLPNLRINKVVYEKDTFRNKCFKKVIEK